MKENMIKDIVITRFAPSPTGLVHLGNMRTALFNYLYAKKQHGKFFLRIEDTDRERSKDEYQEQLQRDLVQLGLIWDGFNGKFDSGVVHQSKREAIYQEYLDKLIADGTAYYCYCTSEELDLARQAQIKAGKAPRYSGRCKNLTQEEIAEFKSKNVLPSIRFSVSKFRKIEFADVIQGKKSFSVSDIGDFIIKKSDESTSFFFSNAVDDSLLETSMVIRGEDHLTNTPRQIMILEALKLLGPNYAHVPLIVGVDSKPLSKRNGSFSIKECLESKGILPIALLNYLARLGHRYQEDNVLMSLEELCSEFSLENIGRAPARFDLQQLDYWQKTAIGQLSEVEFTAWLGESQNNILANRAAVLAMLQANVASKAEAIHLIDLLFADKISYPENTVLDKEFLHLVIAALQKHGADYSLVVQELKNSGLSGKALFLPLRIALTGMASGPEMAVLFNLMGKERLIKRFTHAADL